MACSFHTKGKSYKKEEKGPYEASLMNVKMCKYAHRLGKKVKNNQPLSIISWTRICLLNQLPWAFFQVLLCLALAGQVSSLPILGSSGSDDDYHSNALCVTNDLLQLYNTSTGLWNMDFWQSANIISAVADVYALDSVYHREQGDSIFANTYAKTPGASGYQGFHNNFNDDMGWWAVAFLNIYDLTSNRTYLDKAQDLVDFMGQSSGTPCGGGIWWSRDRSYVAAIANELYIQAAAGLANRLNSPSARSKYFEIADQTFNWFFNSGIVSEDWVVYDGLQQVSSGENSTSDNGTMTCEPTGATFTYNQGVILGAAAELYAHNNDDRYLDLAGNIADATINKNSRFMHDGILGDQCDQNESCSGDGEEFKGPFVRNLRKLWLQSHKDQWMEFLATQAQSIWKNDMQETDNGTCRLGLYWAGPYIAPGDPSVASGIGLDAIVGAWIATDNNKPHIL